jgi:dephospho-CoA kinase
VALTGGIASGKSTCLRRFADFGVPTLDADAVARQAVARGTPALEAIVRRFGPDILRQSGDLDRESLGRLVFADANARHELEAIVHPAVYERISAWFDSWSRAQQEPGTSAPGLAVADIPLLYESGREGDMDCVIVAVCRPEQQLARLVARDGLTVDQARQRIAAQLPMAIKAERADYVIDTSGTLEDTDRQVTELWERLRSKSDRV